MLRAALLLVLALIFTAPALAEWTPTKHGDPRVCKYNDPVHCATDAARYALLTKYQAVTGRAFVGSMRCTPTAALAFNCDWKTATLGEHITPVRFAHKAAGWKASVGVIPT